MQFATFVVMLIVVAASAKEPLPDDEVAQDHDHDHTNEVEAAEVPSDNALAAAAQAGAAAGYAAGFAAGYQGKGGNAIASDHDQAAPAYLQNGKAGKADKTASTDKASQPAASNSQPPSLPPPNHVNVDPQFSSL
jgi:hypothetical protein